MKQTSRSLQRHELYRKYHGQDSKIKDLLGEFGLKTLQTDDVQDGAKEDAACAALDRKITVYVIPRGQKPLVKICGTNTVDIGEKLHRT